MTRQRKLAAIIFTDIVGYTAPKKLLLLNAQRGGWRKGWIEGPAAQVVHGSRARVPAAWEAS